MADPSDEATAENVRRDAKDSRPDRGRAPCYVFVFVPSPTYAEAQAWADRELEGQPRSVRGAADLWWTVFREELDHHETRVATLEERWKERVGSGRLEVHVWPTADLETPLSEQTEALFGDRRYADALSIALDTPGSCVVASPNHAISFDVAPLSHPLEDLLKLAWRVLEGCEPLRCLFHDSPGQHRWLYEPGRVRILAFREAFSRRPDTRGKTILTAPCSPRSFAEAVGRCADRVLGVHGERGYEELWKRPFPRRSRQVLGVELAKRG